MSSDFRDISPDPGLGMGATEREIGRAANGPPVDEDRERMEWDERNCCERHEGD